MCVKFFECVKICPQLRDRQLCEGLNLAEVGQATEGLTGADLRALLHTATMDAETELGDLILQNALEMKERVKNKLQMTEVDGWLNGCSEHWAICCENLTSLGGCVKG